MFLVDYVENLAAKVMRRVDTCMVKHYSELPKSKTEIVMLRKKGASIIILMTLDGEDICY